MAGVLGRFGGALEGLLAGHTPGPVIGFLPDDHCTPSGVAGQTIGKDRMYFEFRAHQLFLANNRLLWTTHDPVAVVAAGFIYNGEAITVPRIVGPNLIATVGGPAGAIGEAIHGTVLEDTLVAGPYPYRGGDVDVTVRLYAVERDNKARTLLRTAERLTGAIAGPGGISTFEKTTEAVLSAIESVFGLMPMRYLAGARLAARKGTLPFRSGYVAVVVPPSAPINTFRVNSDRLCHDAGQGPRPWDGSDFVLLGIHGMESRGDESRLPFYRLRDRAIRAVADGEESWQRAKGYLITAYQEMSVSPDVTQAEAGRLFDEWIETMTSERGRINAVRNLGPAQPKPWARATDADALDHAFARINGLDAVGAT
jgi:hypothetical protein